LKNNINATHPHSHKQGKKYGIGDASSAESGNLDPSDAATVDELDGVERLHRVSLQRYHSASLWEESSGDIKY